MERCARAARLASWWEKIGKGSAALFPGALIPWFCWDYADPNCSALEEKEEPENRGRNLIPLEDHNRRRFNPALKMGWKHSSVPGFTWAVFTKQRQSEGVCVLQREELPWKTCFGTTAMWHQIKYDVSHCSNKSWQNWRWVLLGVNQKGRRLVEFCTGALSKMRC